MKKIFSLFLNAIIICSIILSTAAFEASASSAAPQIYKYTEYLNINSSAEMLDETEETSPISSWSYSDTTSGWSPKIGGQINYTLLTHKRPQFTKSEGVLKLTPSSWTIFDIKPDTTRDNRNPAQKLTEGKFEVSGSVKKDEGASFAVHGIREVHANKSGGVQTNRVEPSASTYGNFTVLTDNPDKWYDFSITVDLDNNKYKITITDPADPSEPVEQIQSNYPYDFGVLRMYIGDSADKYVYLKNLKVTHSLPNKLSPISSVISVGSNGMVQSGTEVQFRLNNEIKDLDAKHIYVTDENGAKISADSISITSDGADIGSDGLPDSIVTASLKSSLLGWSDYTLHIDADCYSSYRRVDGNPIEDMTFSFSTPPSSFDARADKEISAGKVTYSAEFSNQTIPNLPVTLMLAVYDTNGTMVRLVHKTIANSYRNDNTTISETIFADIEDGQTSAFFMINGWGEMRPLFNKKW